MTDADALREAMARGICAHMGIDPDDVRAVNDDMTEVAIPNWRQRTVLGLADAALSAAKVAGWALVPVEATEGDISASDNQEE